MADGIAEALAMLLPPGILFDSPQIYAEVAKLPVVPLEDVRRHWHAYTSMHKKLQDPTACRLENFWWHVWGSDRRNLSGRTLARLWEQIASGPTFVPLRGPQRLLAPRPVPHTRSLHETDLSELSPDGDQRNTRGEAQGSETKLPPQNLTPSSSRPPPSHPILKKPRGPSASGPRPTARFVDVPDSEDDTAQQSSGSQQSGSGASQSDSQSKSQASVRPPAPRTRSPSKVDRKPAAGKKFVASTTALKRRPVLPRRQSSQSSTGSAGSETGSKDANSSAAARQAAQHGPPTAPPTEDRAPSRQVASGLPTHLEVPAPSAKKLGKRPANAPNAGKQGTAKSGQQSGSRGLMNAKAPKRTSSPLSRGENLKESTSGPQASTETAQPAPADALVSSNTPPARGNNPLGIYDGTTGRKTSQSPGLAMNRESPDEKEQTPKAEPKAAGNGAQKSPSGQAKAAPAMVRSKSTEPKRMSSGPVSVASFKSPSVVGMSKFAVTGGFDFETPRVRPSDEDLPPLGADQPDIRKASVLDSRFAPTQPNPAPPPPLGRSKSQLTLLLERDKARVGDRPKVGSRDSQHSDGKDSSKKEG